MLAGCTRQALEQVESIATPAPIEEVQSVVTLNPVYLKTGKTSDSEILPLHFEFSVQEATKTYVEDQLDEIKRILIVYFANKDPKEVKGAQSFLADQALTSTINDFLKSGHIEASKYKVSTEVL